MKTTHARIKAVLMAEVTLFLGCILVSSTAAQTCVPSPAGLVSWWPGDGNATDIVDGNDGTLQGGTTFAPGKVGQAFRFDGVDDHVVVPNLDINTLTFDAWVKRDRTSVPGNFDRLLMSVNDNGWGVYFESDDTVHLT